MLNILSAVTYGIFVLYTPGSGKHYDTKERHEIQRNCVMSAAMANDWYPNTTVYGGSTVYFCKKVYE